MASFQTQKGRGSGYAVSGPMQVAQVLASFEGHQKEKMLEVLRLRDAQLAQKVQSCWQQGGSRACQSEALWVRRLQRAVRLVRGRF